VIQLLVVIAAAGVGLIAVLGLYLAQRGPRRAGLAPVSVLASLLPSVVASIVAASAASRAFSGMALQGTGFDTIVVPCQEAARLLRIGNASAAPILLLAAGLGWLGRRSDAAVSMASIRRLVALFVLPVVALVLVSGAHLSARAAIQEALEIMAPPLPTSNPAVDEEAMPRYAGGGIAETAQRISSRLLIASYGGAVVILVLVGYGAAAAIVAWRVSVPTAWVAAQTVLQIALAMTAVGLAALG
jgi:hypothetical protein